MVQQATIQAQANLAPTARLARARSLKPRAQLQRSMSRRSRRSLPQLRSRKGIRLAISRQRSLKPARMMSIKAAFSNLSLSDTGNRSGLNSHASTASQQLCRRSSLGDRLHNTNPTTSVPGNRQGLNRRGMLALHMQSFIASQGNIITTLNPTAQMGKGTMAMKEIAETSVDMWEAFEDKSPLRKIESTELKKALERANRAGVIEDLFTPFAKAMCPK